MRIFSPSRTKTGGTFSACSIVRSTAADPAWVAKTSSVRMTSSPTRVCAKRSGSASTSTTSTSAFGRSTLRRRTQAPPVVGCCSSRAAVRSDLATSGPVASSRPSQATGAPPATWSTTPSGRRTTNHSASAFAAAAPSARGLLLPDTDFTRARSFRLALGCSDCAACTACVAASHRALSCAESCTAHRLLTTSHAARWVNLRPPYAALATFSPP